MNYAIPPKKMLIINILDILKKYSDENHRLSQKDIIEILKSDYSMEVDRKAIKRNLLNLIDYGYNIECSESIRKNKKGEEETIYTDWYYCHDFDNSELRLLIDCLLFSKTIPYAQCKQLIDKLKALSSIYFDAKVKHICNLQENTPTNPQLFSTIDILDEAITKGHQVTFHYIEYDVNKEPIPRKGKDGNPKIYTVSPYQMVATNGRYYLLCCGANHDSLGNYRIDRIVDIEMTENSVRPKSKVSGMANGLNLSKHMAEHIYMFAGEGIRVKFRSKRYLVTEILDWFGKDVTFSDVTDEEMTASVIVNESAMFYWCMQYGEHVEVLKPEGLRERLKNAFVEISRKY